MILTYVDQQGENGTIAVGLNYYVDLHDPLLSIVADTPSGAR